MKNLITHALGKLTNGVGSSEGLLKIVINTFWLSFDKLLKHGVGLFIGIWVARYLGTVEFGMYSYALAFSQIFLSLAGMGLGHIVVRDLVKYPEDESRILGTTFVIRIFSGLAALGCALWLIYLLKADSFPVRLMVSLIALGYTLRSFEAIELYYHSQVKAKYPVWVRNTAFIFSSIWKLALILLEAPLVYFAGAMLIEAVVSTLGFLLIYRLHRHRIFSWSFDSKLAGRLLKDSWPLIFSGIMAVVFMRIDQLMISELLGDGPLGIYSVAVKLSEAWNFIPVAIAGSVFPSVVKARKESIELFDKRMQRLYNLMTLIGYGVAIPFTFLATPLIGLLFGEAYLEAGPVFSVLIWTAVITGLGTARTTYLMSENMTLVYFMTLALGAAVNVVLNLLLIPVIGLQGAVIATLVSYWVAHHGSCFLYPPLRKTGIMISKALVYPKIW